MHSPRIAQICDQEHTIIRTHSRESLISCRICFSPNDGINQITEILGGGEQGVHMNDYPNELSKTKGSIPDRLLSISV
jgi:hypothetical protein